MIETMSSLETSPRKIAKKLDLLDRLLRSKKPVLVGELNPYGGDPAMALYPLPAHASGGRLQKLLGLSVHRYLDVFDRTNLCTRAWDLTTARAKAFVLEVAPKTDRTFVLLGSKVATAFKVAFTPFTASERVRGDPDAGTWLVRFVVLPHPSGRCRLWNEPGARDKARAALVEAGVLE